MSATRIDVVFAFRRSGEAKLDGGGEVFEDAAPGAFVVRAAAVAFVDDDEVEEVTSEPVSKPGASARRLIRSAAGYPLGG